MGRIDERTENEAIRAELAAIAAQLDESHEKEEKTRTTKRFLRQLCAGCGERVEVTSPQTHVVSSYTGAAYCGNCAINGLPPIEKRPEWNPVRAQTDISTRESVLTGHSTERKIMSATETEASPVFDELMEKVKAEFPGLSLDPKNGYVTLKLDGKTIGYVNGKKKIRIDGIVVEGKQEKLTITESSQIGAGLDLLKRNAAVQATKAAAKAEADAQKKAAAAEAKKSAAAEKAAAKKSPAESAPAAEGEVTPDPKTPATRKRSSRSRKSS